MLKNVYALSIRDPDLILAVLGSFRPHYEKPDPPRHVKNCYHPIYPLPRMKHCYSLYHSKLNC